MLLKNILVILLFAISGSFLDSTCHASKKMFGFCDTEHSDSSSDSDEGILPFVEDSDSSDSEANFEFVKLQAFMSNYFEEAKKGRVKYFEELQEKYITRQLKENPDGSTPKSKSLKQALWLLQSTLNTKMEHGKTALCLAAEHGHLELVKFLLFDCETNTSASSNFETPLNLAKQAFWNLRYVPDYSAGEQSEKKIQYKFIIMNLQFLITRRERRRIITN